MHKLFWLSAQILRCLANEVLPLEGGKLVFFGFLPQKWFGSLQKTAWLTLETALANFRTPIWLIFRQKRFWLKAQIVLAERTNFGMFGK